MSERSVTAPVRFRTRREIHENDHRPIHGEAENGARDDALHGYFDWPRTSTGEEIVEMLGVSAPTFVQHLRTAQRNLLGGLYDQP